ncbi:hypothetical protein [Desulfurobacterium indicum]|uniref:Uncharacterized protein n=1 Tax=Desulfurobacterium indicum TaxID=1914305 RepID=A0A1R1MKK1_9BACT|nr:hypothetical protein [Desulfurobacterium indicum]OMH40230.1 hypothetical protein BLW93_06380 [Desulfurobacterium indicum]
MGVNLAEFSQKLDRLIYNMSEQNKKAYTTFFDPNPQTVQLPQLDENGNLVTVELPNRALIKKQMWDDFGGAIGQMYKTVYVDAVNGDDLNPGTSDAPFKTLSKALSVIPTGGWGIIFLKSDIVYGGTDNVIVAKDNITAIILKDSSLTTHPKITFNNYTKILHGNNNRLWFNSIDFDFNLSGFTYSPSLFMWNTHVYQGDAGISMGGGLGFDYCNININVDFDYLVYLVMSIPFIKMVNTITTYTNSTGNDYFKITDAAQCVNINFEGSWSIIVNGTVLSDSDISSHIVSIVRDTNGVPRNILSNIIL